MVYLTVGIFFLYFCIMFFAGGKNILNPVVLIMAGYIFVFVLSIYSEYHYDYNVSNTTYLYYILSATIIFIVSFAMQCKFCRNKEIVKTVSKVDYDYRIENSKFVILLLLQIIIFLWFFNEYRNILDINFSFSNLSDYIYRFRIMSGYGINGVTVSLSFLTSNLLKVSGAITFVSLYYLAADRKKTFRKYVIALLLILPTIIEMLLRGTRFDFAVYMIFYIVIYLCKQTNCRIKFRTVVIFIVIAVAGISVSRFIIGRGEDKTVLDYISSYFGNVVLSFDLLIKEGLTPNYNLKNTFYGIYQFLDHFFDVGLDSFGEGFMYYNGNNLGNVYGCVYNYFKDFGIVGILLLSSIFAFVANILYIRLFNSKKDKKIDWNLIIYAMLAYALFLDGYSGGFLRALFSLDMVVDLVSMWLLIKFIERSRFRKRALRTYR